MKVGRRQAWSAQIPPREEPSHTVIGRAGCPGASTRTFPDFANVSAWRMCANHFPIPEIDNTRKRAFIYLTLQIYCQ
jgi:hypothetical protein